MLPRWRRIAGANLDFRRRDLFERIERGDYPGWELGPQLFDEAFANSQPYDVLDATKIIPEEVLPVRIVGKLVLDRYPDSHLAEPEQAAFVPSHVVPGIGLSNDPLLQGRLLSYTDTQLSRRVADGLAMELPPAPPAAAPVLDMEPSPALRIIRGPLEKHRLEGRTVGILIADG